jgi:hypothetical protein
VSIEVSKSVARQRMRDQPVSVADFSGSVLGWLVARARTVVSGGLSMLLRKRRVKSVIEQAESEHLRRLEFAEEYARGYLAGWKECFRACQEAMEESNEGGWNN